MKKLIIFTGLHKTGSTSIQQTCVRGQRALYAQGFQYFPEMLPSRQFTVNGSGNHSRLLRFAFRKSPQLAFEQDQLEAYKRASSEIRSGMQVLLGRADGTVLMVAEALSNFSPSELNELKSWFAGQGFRIHPVCCVRKPSAWLSSMVAQRVAGEQGPRLTIEAAVQEFVTAAGIVVPRLKNLLAAFPNLGIYGFESAVNHPMGPAGFFFDRIGFRPPAQLTALRANDRASAHSVRLLSLINAAIGPLGASDENRRFNKVFTQNHPALTAIPGERFALLESEAAPLLGLLAEENRWLREHLGDGFFDHAVGFAKGPVLLKDDERAILERQSTAGNDKVSRAVREYLASN